MPPDEPSAIVRRICRDAGAPDLVEIFSDRLAGADLRSLLLHVTRERSARRTPPQLIAQHLEDRTVRAGSFDARLVNDLERRALAAATGWVSHHWSQGRYLREIPGCAWPGGHLQCFRAVQGSRVG